MFLQAWNPAPVDEFSVPITAKSDGHVPSPVTMPAFIVVIPFTVVDASVTTPPDWLNPAFNVVVAVTYIVPPLVTLVTDSEVPEATAKSSAPRKVDVLFTRNAPAVVSPLPKVNGPLLVVFIWSVLDPKSKVEVPFAVILSAPSLVMLVGERVSEACTMETVAMSRLPAAMRDGVRNLRKGDGDECERRGGGRMDGGTVSARAVARVETGRRGPFLRSRTYSGSCWVISGKARVVRDGARP